MVRRWFQNLRSAEHRGGSLPGCSRFPWKRGVTLVELLISMLILAIVCMAWLQIIGIQSAKKEARRREAVERLVGMMDAFLYQNRQVARLTVGTYQQVTNGTSSLLNLTFTVDNGTGTTVFPMFDSDVSPIGYQLEVVYTANLPDYALFGSNWGSKTWLIGRLYNHSGDVSDVGKPFFELPVCTGL